MITSFHGDYFFLSNFSPVPDGVWYESMLFPTVEHAYQAAKTHNQEWRNVISSAATPGIAKKLGRKLILRADWEQVKLEVMESLLREKFSNPELRRQLLDTRDEVLIEGNDWGDTFWGICEGFGDNHLGRLLMKLRKEMRDAV